MSPIVRRFALRLSAVCFLSLIALSSFAQPLTFTTLAGPAGGPGSADGTGNGASFFNPQGVATDSVGNVYVADQSNHTIRKITPAGMVTTLAGLAGSPGSADGTGAAARFNGPSGVATDSGGNVYVADTQNSTIRKITAAGVVTTLAGSAGLSGSTDGSGSVARFSWPRGMATDSSGNVYVADTSNNTIRKISTSGAVSTLAGSSGYCGMNCSIDGTGSAARFDGPRAVATDGGGNVYVADMGNKTIRKITPNGVVTTFAGTGGVIGSADGTGAAASFYIPDGVATDAAGNIYVSDTGNMTIRKITPGAVVTTMAGSAGLYGSTDGTGNAARFASPEGIATDSSGNVYVADGAIRKITAGGAVTTFAGLSAVHGSADATGSAASFFTPGGVATDTAGNVYVADKSNYTIRKITAAGVVTTLAGSAGVQGSADGTGSAASFTRPQAVATDYLGNVYVADTDNSTIRKITPSGVVTTLAGTPGYCSFNCAVDGLGSAARFNLPSGVATDNNGNIYVADTNNQIIRMITPAGNVTTLAGSAGLSGSTDGTGSAARFYTPTGVATDSTGNVYVADFNNNKIRKITQAGVVTTLAGSGSIGSADGSGSGASFSSPWAVATDSGGNVYVADTAFSSFPLPNNTIRKITPAGVVTTIGGSPGIAGSSEGTGSAATFNTPLGVATDSAGNVYVGDSYNNKIRVGRTALADAAIIDRSTGTIGTVRYFETSQQNATSWQWTVIRRPSTSTAQLSSTSIRNPVFTPDVVDVFVFRLTASDGTKTSITTVSLTSTPPPVTCPTITVSPATLPNGSVGTAYTHTITVTGGSAAYTFVVATGALPPGVSLNSTTGALSGTPTAAGTFNSTVKVTDANGCNGTRVYSIVVTSPSCPAIVLSPTILPNGVVGTAYSQTITATGGTAPYTFSVTSGGLPPGLSLSAAGAITGTPTTVCACTFYFTVTATDASLCVGSRSEGIAEVISLGAAANFAILGSSSVTNTGVSTIRGNVGVSPGTSVTGFPPGVITGGTTHAADALATQAQTDLAAAYNAITALTCNTHLGLTDIGGRTLTPAVYCDLGPILSGTLTLDFQGDPNAVFVFQTPSVFAPAANSSVVMINAAGNSCPPNVFWQVGFGPHLGANSVFVGNILGNDIGLGTGATLNGRALARSGAVTLDSNSAGTCPATVINGDANGDGAITPADVIYMLNALFTGGPTAGLTDVDGDGQVTVADVFYLLNYLFAGGPPPV